MAKLSMTVAMLVLTVAVPMGHADDSGPDADHDEREIAEQKFAREAIGFGDGVAVTTSGKSTSVMSFRFAYQGELRRPLETPEFLRIVGRDDLADSYVRRRRLKIGFMTGGSLAVLGGSALAFKYLFMTTGTDYCIPSYPSDPAADAACEQRNADIRADAKPWLYAGIGLASAGLIAILVPAFFDSNPVDTNAYYELANSHNEKLRRKYGLPTASTDRGRPRRTRNVMVTPYASPDGGGFAMTGRF